MSCNRVLTALLTPTLLMGTILGGAANAVAQQAGAPQVLGPQPYGAPAPNGANAIGVAPLTPPQQFAAPPADLTPQTALTGAAFEPIKTQATLCVRPVIVDGDPH